MKKLLFVTKNKKKIEEVKAMIGDKYQVESIDTIGWNEEIPEPYDTIKENAIYKAKFFYRKTSLDCITEDSGLEVDYLDGAPGAYSARYAGEEKNDTFNNEKLLSELKNDNKRTARFRSVFCLAVDGVFRTFEGTMEGEISHNPKGTNGFGYDPIFVAEGKSISNAELTLEEKNSISHRGKSLSKLYEFLQKD